MKKLTKNIIFLSSAQIADRLLSFIFIIFAARYLGVAVFGRYSIVITLLMFFNIISDFGTRFIVIKEVAKDGSQVKKYLNNLIILKLLLGTVFYGVMLILANMLNYSYSVMILILIAGITLIFTSLNSSYIVVLDACERMDIPALTGTIFTVASTLGGIIILRLGFGLESYFSYLVLLGILSSLWFLGVISRKIALPRLEFDVSFCWDLLKASFPYAVLVVLGIIYFKIDIIMLSKMKNEQVVGWYTAGYKLIEALMIFSNSIGRAIFPVMARLHKDSPDRLKFVYEKSLKYLFILALPATILIMLFADKIILLLYGKGYLNSILTLRILGLALLVIFLHTPNGILFFSGDFQKTIIKLGILTMSTNIILNFILIPPFSLVGASWATLISEVVSFVIFYILAAKYLKLKINILKIFTRPVIAGIIMMIFAVLLRRMNFLILLMIVTSIYLVLVFILKVLDEEDKHLAFSLFFQKDQKNE